MFTTSSEYQIIIKHHSSDTITATAVIDRIKTNRRFRISVADRYGTRYNTTWVSEFTFQTKEQFIRKLESII
jgi:hypothetical protein